MFGLKKCWAVSFCDVVCVLLTPLHSHQLTSERALSESQTQQRPEKETQSLATNKSVATVAYVLSITKCRWKFARQIHDPDMVLKRSIEDVSFPSFNSRCRAECIAIVPPKEAKSACAATLLSTGCNVTVLDFPILPQDIQDHNESLQLVAQEDHLSRWMLRA